MKKYLVTALLSILLITGCTNNQIPSSEASSSENTNEISSEITLENSSEEIISSEINTEDSSSSQNNNIGGDSLQPDWDW